MAIFPGQDLDRINSESVNIDEEKYEGSGEAERTTEGLYADDLIASVCGAMAIFDQKIDSKYRSKKSEERKQRVETYLLYSFALHGRVAINGHWA